MKEIVIMQAMSLAKPERRASLSTIVNNLVWSIRVYCRWLIVTTMAAPNPMLKGGEA